MKKSFCRYVLLTLSGILFSTALPGQAVANSFGVNLYGISYHILNDYQSREFLNEFNPGVGFRATFGGHNESQIFVEGGTYADTFENPAKYFSAGFLVKVVQQFRVGINAAIYVTESTNDGEMFFAPVPIVSYTLGPVTGNGVYLPRYGNINPYQTLGFYLTIRLFQGNVEKKSKELSQFWR